MNVTQKCIVCGADSKLKHRNYPGFKEPDTFDIYHCRNCNTSFPFPVKEDFYKLYDLIYENKSEIKGYKRYFHYSKEVKLKKDPFRYLAFQESPYYGVWKTLKNTINPGVTKVLEVGSGLGYLTYSLKKAGFDVIGIDISEKVVAQASLEFGENYKCLDIFEYAKNPPNLYDYIVLTEVIEHVPNPIDFIRTLLSLLCENGKLIVSTPNKGLYAQRAIWGSDMPPVHLSWLSEKSMRVISDITQSKVSFINFEDFYRENPTIIDVEFPNFKRSEVLGGPPIPTFPSPVFNKKGKLNIIEDRKSLYEQFKTWVFSKKILMNFYSWYMILRNPNFKKLTSEGQTICAIFEK